MKTFTYRGYTQDGRSENGLLEALDLKEAREKLAHRGVLAERVELAGDAAPARRRARRAPFSLEARATLYRELEALLQAGLPMAKALDLLLETPEWKEEQTLLAGVRDDVREGRDFALALAGASRDVSAFEQAILTAGERAGNMGGVLSELAGFMEEQLVLRDRVQTALVYPLIVLGLAVAIGIFVVGIMMPMVEKLLAQTAMSLPWITRAMLGFSGALQWVGPPVLVLLVLSGFWWRATQRGRGPGRLRLDRWRLALPLVGHMLAPLINLRFSRTLALLLRGGVDVVEALSLSGQATGNAWVARQCMEASDEVSQGRSIADVLREVPPLNHDLPGWIQAGEAGGNLPDLLLTAARRYAQRWDRMMSRYLAFLEPVTILFVGGIVLMVALAILLPLLQLNRTLM